MRTARPLTAGLVALAAGCAATTALAALARPSTRYSGTGTLYANNGPHWNRGEREPISFTTSSDGRKLLHFKGGFAFYCGGASGTVTAREVFVSAKGRFAYRFWVPSHGPNKQVNGRIYINISGSFVDGGRRAAVSYLVDDVFTGTKVKNPYSPSNPRALGCAAWIRGTVRPG